MDMVGTGRTIGPIELDNCRQVRGLEHRFPGGAKLLPSPPREISGNAWSHCGCHNGGRRYYWHLLASCNTQDGPSEQRIISPKMPTVPELRNFYGGLYIPQLYCRKQTPHSEGKSLVVKFTDSLILFIPYI